MILEDEHEADEDLEEWINIEREEDLRRREAGVGNRDGNDDDRDPDEEFERSIDLETFIRRRHEIRDETEHNVLKEALKNHLWKLKGSSCYD